VASIFCDCVISKQKTGEYYFPVIYYILVYYILYILFINNKLEHLLNVILFKLEAAILVTVFELVGF
jgi:hypothetical protein